MLEDNEIRRQLPGGGAVSETTSRREEAVTTGVGGCLQFLEGSVNKKQTAPLGANKFEKVNGQFNKVFN